MPTHACVVIDSSLIGGFRMTEGLTARCARFGIRCVDANELRRLGEHVRRLIGR